MSTHEKIKYRQEDKKGNKNVKRLNKIKRKY